ncbi:hypothetical protein DMENIID0001_016280 [Sergentomyia squamirostris]
MKRRRQHNLWREVEREQQENAIRMVVVGVLWIERALGPRRRHGTRSACSGFGIMRNRRATVASTRDAIRVRESLPSAGYIKGSFSATSFKHCLAVAQSTTKPSIRTRKKLVHSLCPKTPTNTNTPFKNKILKIF